MPLPVSRRLRHVLLRNLSLFVSPVGSDTNDGLHPSRPFRSIQAAVEKAIRLDTASHGIDIILAPGTYPGNITLGRYPGSRGITICSESFAERDATIISGTVNASNCGHWELRHLTLSNLLRVRRSHISLRGTNHLINSDRDYCIESAFHSTVTVEDNGAWDSSDLYLTYSSGVVKSWLSIRAHGAADLTDRVVECIYTSAPTWTQGGVWLRTSGILEALRATTVNDNLLGYEIKAEGGSAAYIADGDNLPGEGRVGDSTSTIGTGGTKGTGDAARILLFPNDGTHVSSGGGGIDPSQTFRFSVLQRVGATEPLTPWSLSDPVSIIGAYERIVYGDSIVWTRNTPIVPPLASVEQGTGALLRYYSPADPPGPVPASVTAWGEASFGANVFDLNIRMFTDIADYAIVPPVPPYYVAIKIHYCGGGQPYTINSASVTSGTCVIDGFCYGFGFPSSTSFPSFTLFSPTFPQPFMSDVWIVLRWANLSVKNAVVKMNIDNVPITFRITIPG